MSLLINSQQETDREWSRRRKLLGPLLDLAEFDRAKFVSRAREVDIPPQIIFKWWSLGIDAIAGQFDGVEEEEWMDAIQLRQDLGLDIEDETIDPKHIKAIAQQNGWTFTQAKRLIQRYRLAGLSGLTKTGNPFSVSSAEDNTKNTDRVRDVGTLDEPELEVMFQRYHHIYPLLQKERLTNRDVANRAEELRQSGVKISSRTLRNYLRRYQKHGKKGLAPLRRGDVDEFRGISPIVVDITRGIRLSKSDLPVRAVYEKAEQTAVQLGEWPPSLFQVRSICEQIPVPVQVVADKRQGEFRNKYRLTYGMQFDGVVYQMDHTQIDLLVIDQRSKKYRTKSGEIRPWLTTVIESRSRRVLAYILGYDQPDRFTVAATIREALLCGGVPHEIWVDNGKDLLAQYIYDMARELGIDLKPLEPHQPQQKGRVERVFGVLNTRLWSKLEGYVGSNTVQRNPTTRAKYTIQQVDEILSAFIANYNKEPHSSTGGSPLAVWQEQCFTNPVDERDLDMLLMEAKRRRVQKFGISFKGRTYWHTELGLLVGRDVIVRTPHPYLAPDTLEVFSGDRWVCSAFATDSQRGKAITRDDIAQAQRQQNKLIKSEITQAKAIYEHALDETGPVETQTPTSSSSQPNMYHEPPTPSPQKNKRSEKRRKPDFLDRMEY